METMTSEEFQGWISTPATKNANRQAGGRKAKAAGDEAEALFESACNEYKDHSRLDWQKTFPEIVITGRGMRGQVTGFPKEKGTADYVGSITELSGKTFWLEVKNVYGKNTKTINKSHHQCKQMQSATKFGALGFYLLRWHNDDFIEWRLYPVRNVVINDNLGITFERDKGFLCQAVNDRPMWLDVALEI